MCPSYLLLLLVTLVVTHDMTATAAVNGVSNLFIRPVHESTQKPEGEDVPISSREASEIFKSRKLAQAGLLASEMVELETDDLVQQEEEASITNEAAGRGLRTLLVEATKSKARRNSFRKLTSNHTNTTNTTGAQGTLEDEGKATLAATKAAQDKQHQARVARQAAIEKQQQAKGEQDAALLIYNSAIEEERYVRENDKGEAAIQAAQDEQRVAKDAIQAAKDKQQTGKDEEQAAKDKEQIAKDEEQIAKDKEQAVKDKEHIAKDKEQAAMAAGQG